MTSNDVMYLDDVTTLRRRKIRIIFSTRNTTKLPPIIDVSMNAQNKCCMYRMRLYHAYNENVQYKKSHTQVLYPSEEYFSE